MNTMSFGPSLNARKAPVPPWTFLGLATRCMAALRSSRRRRGGGRDGLETLKFFERRQIRSA
jgi:hypothetical protein